MKPTSLIWNPPTKRPKVFTGKETIVCRTVRGITPSFKVDVMNSKDILMRVRHGKTHYRLGDKGWGDYPDSQAGKYKYFIGKFQKNLKEDGKTYDEGAFLNSGGHDCVPDEWAELPNCVAAGYNW
jgi:hypothetical protein